MDYLARILENISSEDYKSELSKVWECLLNLGLTRRQAAVFIVLYLKGPLSVREISDGIGMHQVAVHKTLKELYMYNLVDVLLGIPNRYVVKDTDDAVRSLLDFHLNLFKMTEKYGSQLKEVLNKLDRKLDKIHLPNHEKERPNYRVVFGRRQLYSEIIKVLGETKKEHCIIMSPYGVKRVVKHELVDYYRECVDRGVNIKVITEINKSNFMEASYMDKIVDLRHLPNIKLRLNVSDSGTMIIGAVYKDEDLSLFPKDEIHLIVCDNFLCNAFKRIFMELWKNSRDASKVIQEITQV